MGDWIEIKWHMITEEEREKEGYPDDWVYFLDSEMPEDEQEILITVRSKHGNYVEKDTCLIDEGYYLDSGHDWRTDVIAWMPLPEPYREGEDELIDMAVGGTTFEERGEESRWWN